MDAENNPENPEQEIELLEDDFEEVVDLDGEDEAEEGTTLDHVNVHLDGSPARTCFRCCCCFYFTNTCL